MKTLCICTTCGKVVKEDKRLLKLQSVSLELGILVKKVACGSCEDKKYRS